MKPLPAFPARFTSLVLGVLMPAHLALAQTTDQPAAKPRDEVVVLSPYVISSESEEGYYSPQAVSGTRTRTELIDLPMNLTVFNENFIHDIGATDLVDIVSFASGVSGGATAASDAGGGDTLGFILRGQGGFVPNRNGFRRLRLVDPVTISHVEVLKGPASVLYGQASPGGSVNYITKRPVQRKIASTALTVGSYDRYKAAVDVNVPTESKNLALRFVGSYEEAGSWIDRYKSDTTVLYPSATWWIKPETTLTFEYESTIRHQNPQGPLPFHPRLKPDDQPWAVDLNYNTRGPDDWFDVEMSAMTLEFIHKFNANLTLRANATNVAWEDNVRLNSATPNINSVAGGAPTNPPMLPGRSFNRSSRGSFDNYRQIELLNNFTYRGVKVQNLLGYQYGQEKFVQLYAGITPQPALDSVFWNLNDPSTWILSQRLEDIGSGPGTGNRFRNTLNSFYFTNQMTFMGDKLHTLFGLRTDKIDADNYANANTPNPVQSYADYPLKTSPQFGVLYKVTPELALFGSYSTSIVNLYTTIARNPDGSTFNPVPGTGEGFDFGVKADMLDGRVSGVLSFYSLEEQDIIRNLGPYTVDGETFNASSQTGVNHSQGVELDLSTRPFKGTQLGFAYAYTDAYVKSDTSAAASVIIDGVLYRTREGHQLAYSPNHQVSFNVRQDLGAFGALDKTYITANGRWVDVRNYTETYNNINGVLTPPWTFDPYMTFSVGVGAQFNIGKQVYNAALIVKNIFDERYYANRFYYGAPRTIDFTLRVKF